uniref:Uncharacterized protein n=1 Tax=Medicago truncatula TaxID=3880 RepID=Q1S5M2_MEDTR|nr:hypothetical protein MtrDRAFT_AC147431g34v2 [Medicago truncatula]
MVVMVVSPISNLKTVFQALSLMAAPPPSWLTSTRPPPKPPWLGYVLDLLLADVSLVHSFNAQEVPKTRIKGLLYIKSLKGKNGIKEDKQPQ